MDDSEQEQVTKSTSDTQHMEQSEINTDEIVQDVFQELENGDEGQETQQFLEGGQETRQYMEEEGSESQEGGEESAELEGETEGELAEETVEPPLEMSESEQMDHRESSQRTADDHGQTETGDHGQTSDHKQAQDTETAESATIDVKPDVRSASALQSQFVSVKQEIIEDQHTDPSILPQTQSFTNIQKPIRHSTPTARPPSRQTHDRTRPRVRQTNEAHKLNFLKENVEQKSHLLSSAWTELYTILGEYKAELFSKQELNERYDNVDTQQLQDEMLEKDNEIIELRQQLDKFQKHAEQCEMDLSVKDSLLKKYQQDLLQKEADLLTSNSKVTRLENRLRALESRAQFDGPPKKIMRTSISPSRSPGMMGRSSMVGRSPMGAIRPMKSPGIMGRMMHQGMMPQKRRMPMPVVSQQQRVPAVQPIPAPHPVPRAAPAPVRPPPAPSQKSSPSSSSQQVICIEVDDDDELQEITDATQALTQQSVDAPLQTQQRSTDLTQNWQSDSSQDLHHDPNTELQQQHEQSDDTGQYVSDFGDQSMDLSTDSQPGFSGDTLDQSAPWPVELTQNQASMAQAGAGATNKMAMPRELVLVRASVDVKEEIEEQEEVSNEDSEVPSQLKLTQQGPPKYRCNHCGQLFHELRALQKHKDEAHSMNPQTCEICGDVFQNRHMLVNHISSRHGASGSRDSGGGKMFRCSNRDCLFQNRFHLEQHMNIQGCDGKMTDWQEGSRPKGAFACNICGRVLSSQQTLLIHINGMHKMTTFPCSNCGKNFKYQSNLSRHFRTCRHQRRTSI